ncbi:hypothetical protein Pst134EB_009964 [Puccinia striiformis f. sp. tritici]|nr:hypothetical protein Pst134EB_009964 [Puccinia striiformis f. sp. tritici]
MSLSPSSSSVSSIDDTFELHNNKSKMNQSITFIVEGSDQLFPQRTLTPPSSGLPIIIGRAADPDKQAKFKTSAPYQAAPDNAKFHCPVMSRTHAQLTWIDQKPYLQDTGSTHGTWYQPSSRVFVPDSKGRKTRNVPHAAWDKIPKSLLLQEGMSIRFGRAITNPSNKARHTPLEVTIRFHRPSNEPAFKSGTYGLKNIHLNLSDDSNSQEEETESIKNTMEDVLGLPLVSPKKQVTDTDQRAPSTAKWDTFLTNPPDSTSIDALFILPHGHKKSIDPFLSGNPPLKLTRPSAKEPSPMANKPMSVSRPKPKPAVPEPQQSHTSTKPATSGATPSVKQAAVVIINEDKSMEHEEEDEEDSERSQQVEEESGEIDLQCTYGAKEAHNNDEEEAEDSSVEEESSSAPEDESNVQEDSSNPEEEHNSVEQEHSGYSDIEYSSRDFEGYNQSSVEEHSGSEEEDSVIRQDPKDAGNEIEALDGIEVVSQPAVQQAPEVQRKGGQSKKTNQVTQPDAAVQEDEEENEVSISESVALPSPTSCQEIASSTKNSSAVDNPPNKQVTKSIKDLSVVTTITSQTQFTETLNQLPESLLINPSVQVSFTLQPLHSPNFFEARTFTELDHVSNRLPIVCLNSQKSPQLKRLLESSGDHSISGGGNSISSDSQVVDGSPTIQFKRKRPVEFDEEEEGEVETGTPSRSTKTKGTMNHTRKSNKRVQTEKGICQHCSHEVVHPTKKIKFTSKLASVAQSVAIFALGGVATVAGILAFENVIVD